MPSEPHSPSTETVADSPRNLRVSWQSPEEPNGVITMYTVYCYQANSSPDNITTAIVAGTDLEAIVGGLTPYTFYHCNVTANTSVGEGPFSKTTTGRTDESGNLVVAINDNKNEYQFFFFSSCYPSGQHTSYRSAC